MRFTILLAISLGPFASIAATKSVLPAAIASFLEDQHSYVTEDGLVAPGVKGGGDFIQYVTDHWESILGDFAVIAPDARRQHLITAAAESLSPNDYVEFLRGVCDLVENDRLPGFDVDSIVDGSGQKEGFLAYNYDDPRVAVVVGKIEALARAKRPHSADDAAYFAQLESGKMKENLVTHRKEEGESLPQKLTGDQIHPSQSPSAESSIVTPSPSIKAPIGVGSNRDLRYTSQVFASAEHRWTVILMGLGICVVTGTVIILVRRRSKK